MPPPIDLSAGLVPANGGGVVLSAGLVAKAPSQAAAAPQQGFFSSAADSSGLSMIKWALTHPLDAAKAAIAPMNPFATAEDIQRNPVTGAMISTADEANQAYQAAKSGNGAGVAYHAIKAVPVIGGVMDKAADQYADKNYAGEAGTLAGLGAAIVGPKAVEAGLARVAALPDAAKTAVLGSKVDQVIPGETVTPRQQYQIAKGQGVQLDAAQATNSPALAAVKKVTDSSLGGSPAYKANFAQNANALQIHAENLLDQASPVAMTREQFGNAAKAKLLEDLATQKDNAGELYDQLSDSVGTNQPSVKGIKQQAQAIVDRNKGYYDKHGDLLQGGARKAWNIIKNLADAPEPGTPEAEVRPPDTWSDLHMLRSDLMDLTRGPEYIGDRPTGWIKQMTGAVDQAMTDSSAGLSKADLDKFREANDIYSRVKEVYDTPQSPLYSILRAPDGLTAADSISRLKPGMIRQVANSAPDLVAQLQRQTIARLLDPAGNVEAGTGAYDLKNLPTRFAGMPKEQLGGILSPQQMTDLENLARTSRVIHATDNASGTAVKLQPIGEASVIGSGLYKTALSAIAGNPLGVAEGLAPAGWYGATKLASKAMMKPGVVDSLMERPSAAPPPVTKTGVVIPAGTGAAVAATRGQQRWMDLGAAKLNEHLSRAGTNAEISAAEIDGARSSPAGQELLIQASDLEPGSAAMRDVIRQIKALSQQD